MQCVSEEHGKPPGGKTVGTRWRASPCKEEGQAVNAKPRSLTLSDFEDICTIPTSGNILIAVLAVLLPSSFTLPSYCYAIMSVQ